MTKWRVYTYDVWGNAKDGYEVMDVFRTNEVIDIPEKALETDKGFLDYLMKIKFFRKGTRRKDLDISGQEDIVSFDYKGRPEFELRKE